MNYDLTELLDKASNAGANLGAFAKRIQVGPATYGEAPVPWSRSDSATFASSSTDPSIFQCELLLSELVTLRRLLGGKSLFADQAFAVFVDTLKSAFIAFERSGVGQRYEQLAVALAVARTVLQDEVGSVQSWLIIARACGQKEEFVPVPSRFIGKKVTLKSEELAEDTVADWLVLETLAD